MTIDRRWSRTKGDARRLASTADTSVESTTNGVPAIGNGDGFGGNLAGRLLRVCQVRVKYAAKSLVERPVSGGVACALKTYRVDARTFTVPRVDFPSEKKSEEKTYFLKRAVRGNRSSNYCSRSDRGRNGVNNVRS